MSQNINSFATPSVTLNKSIDSGTSNINSECYAVQNSIDCGTSNINSIDSNYMESESLQNAPDAVSLAPPSLDPKPMTLANSDENHASGIGNEGDQMEITESENIDFAEYTKKKIRDEKNRITTQRYRKRKREEEKSNEEKLKEISVEVLALLLEAYAEIIKCEDLNFKISKFKTILMEVRVKVLDCEEEIKRLTGCQPRKDPLFLDVANNVHMDLSSKSIPPIDASTKFAALKKETKDPNYMSRMAEFIEFNGNLPPQQISPSTSSHGSVTDYKIQN